MTDENKIVADYAAASTIMRRTFAADAVIIEVSDDVNLKTVLGALAGLVDGLRAMTHRWDLDPDKVIEAYDTMAWTQSIQDPA